MSTQSVPLKYHLNCELRQRIAKAVDQPSDRYQPAVNYGLNHATVWRVADVLGVYVEDEDRELADLTLAELYELIGEPVGVEYRGNAGCQWGMRRELLKAIVQEVDA